MTRMKKMMPGLSLLSITGEKSERQRRPSRDKNKEIHRNYLKRKRRCLHLQGSIWLVEVTPMRSVNAEVKNGVEVSSLGG